MRFRSGEKVVVSENYKVRKGCSGIIIGRRSPKKYLVEMSDGESFWIPTAFLTSELDRVDEPQMTPDEQLKMWVDGNSVHNTDRDECCPDFSCCNPHLKAKKEEREQFAAANKAERGAMLYQFLSRLVKCKLREDAKKIHIVGSPGPMGKSGK